MEKAAFMFFQAAILVLALSVCSSEGHNRSQTTNIYNTNVDINLAGAFDRVFAFGDSGTDNGNAHLMGTLQSFVGAWLQAVHGALAAGAGGTASASSSSGAGGSASGSGGASGTGSVSGDTSVVGNGLSNGKLVIEHVCDALGISHVPPYKNQSGNFSNGVNFALAGSTALPGSFFLRNHNNLLSLMWKTVPQSYDLQLQWFNDFMQNLKNGAKPNMDGTLFWLGSVGANDFARIHRAAAFSSEWITQNAIDQVSKLIQGMVNHGAKHFVIQGLPPIGCLPLDLILAPITERDQYGCAARINKAVMNHNELLQQKLGELQKMFPHCVFVYADFWKAFMKVLSGYHQFGFVEPFKACCGFGGGHFNFDLLHLCGRPHASVCAKAAEHMIWDGIHFSAALNKVIAKLFIHGGCTHPSIVQLIKLKKGLIHHL